MLVIIGVFFFKKTCHSSTAIIFDSFSSLIFDFILEVKVFLLDLFPLNKNLSSMQMIRK